jgi:TolB-like protein/tetratricopeptide (TPR) repeat protein
MTQRRRTESFIAELRRRNVLRMAGLYLVGAWLVTQVADTILPMFGAPDGAARSVVILLAIGFVPALVFSWIFELTPEGLKRDGEVPVGESIAPQTARRMDRMIIVVLLLALGYFAVDKFVLAPAQDDVARETSPSAPADAKSIAVLAFANLSPDKDNEYFSDGVAEEILNALARIEDLRVAGRTSSFYFKGRNESLATIGSTLGVAHVLEGSVRKQGERLRISAQLIRVGDGIQLWSGTFDGTDADIFALQEHIAREVSRELKVALTVGADQRLVNAGTANPEAYALYLRATDIFNRREAERYEDGIASARQALRLDPGFARAHSRLATLYYLWANVAIPERHERLIAEAVRQVQSALDLDPQLAEPHAVLALLHWTERRYAVGTEAILRALAIDPNDLTTAFWAALRYCQAGAIDLCERELDRVLALDPLLPNALSWRARLYASAGDWVSAERMIHRARDAGLRWFGITLYRISMRRGDRETAQAQLEEIQRIFGPDLTAEAITVFAAARLGDERARLRTRAIIDDYMAAAPARINAVVPLTLVDIGDVERGLRVFADHATTNDALFMGEILGTRLYPDAWASPAFPDFLRKVGIADYWDRVGAPSHCRKDATGDYRCQ